MYSGIIYCATSPSNKKYYGKTVRKLSTRINGHLKKSQGSFMCRFYSAIRKYNIENFSWEIIETIQCETKEERAKILNEREIYWIEKDKTYIAENGYNMTKGGDGGATRPEGYTLSEETKEKIRSKLKNQKYSEERRKNMSAGGKGISRGKGKPKSKIHRQHLSEVQLGRTLSVITRKRMSDAKKKQYAEKKKYKGSN